MAQGGRRLGMCFKLTSPSYVQSDYIATRLFILLGSKRILVSFSRSRNAAVDAASISGPRQV
jgi:hypothetical protein